MRTLLVAGAVLLAGAVAFPLATRGGERERAADVVAAVKGGAFLLDVRTAREYEAGPVASARHANMLAGDFRQRVGGLDCEQTVYVYCASGHRSGRAAQVMEMWASGASSTWAGSVLSGRPAREPSRKPPTGGAGLRPLERCLGRCHPERSEGSQRDRPVWYTVGGNPELGIEILRGRSG